MKKNNILCSFLLIVFFIALQSVLFADEQNQFSVALTGKYPPFSMYDSKGELVGFDVDVSQRIADKLERKLKLVPTEWDGILPGLLAGKYDAIIGSMAITEPRKKQVNFSTPYYVSGAQLFIHKDLKDKIKSIKDCKGKKIGVVLGETFEHFLRKKHPEINTVTYKSTVDIFQDVASGRLDGFVSDKLLGMYQIKKSGRPLVPAGELLYKEKMGIPVTKKNASLLKKINKALAKMQSNGELKTLFDKWFAAPKTKTAVEKKKTAISTKTVAEMLGKGFAITLFTAVVSLLIGFIIAIPSGVILNNPKIWGHRLLRGVNDFIRGTPVLIQLFFVYFGLGSKEVGLNLTPLTAAIITLAVNASAYMSEVVRSGLMSVNPGQLKAGRALGLNKMQIFIHIVWPQAFRIALPALMNSVVALLKDTALISVISVGEVIREAQSIISVTFNPVKYYLIVAVMFFIVTFPLMKYSAYLERRIKNRGFSND
jgi:His/Glu/Gln/Arg/opine family amino acid ABC transporter permease subunit